VELEEQSVDVHPSRNAIAYFDAREITPCAFLWLCYTPGILDHIKLLYDDYNITVTHEVVANE
jgi:hypothetical protein